MSVDAEAAIPEFSPEREPSPGPSLSTPGELLKAARADRSVSIQQIADDLHLDVRVVEAIESNNFSSLGPPVYSRGYLRKYATVIGLSPDEVIASYEKLTDVPVVQAPIPASVAEPLPERVSLRVPVLAVGGVAAVALVLWIASAFLNRTETPATVSAVPQSTAASPSPAESAQLEGESGQQTAAPTTIEREAAAVAAAGTNGVTMRLRFNDASWVEVYDATDRRLLYEIGQPGEMRTVAGVAPLRVTLGLASAVTMEVNERSVPVPRRAGKDAARFSLAADGSVR